MTNLLKETEEVLLENGKLMSDIVFVSGNGHEIPLDNFIKAAKSYDYDSGFGSEEVPLDLLVVGKDWWIERHEYDGSEWWEYKTLPPRPKTVKKISGFDADNKYLYNEEGGDECKSRDVDLSSVHAVCFDCAKLLGFKLKDKAVGIWPDDCDVCHKHRACTDLWHDWEPIKEGETK